MSKAVQPSESEFLQRLEVALARRRRLLATPDTDVARLVNDRADQLDGLVLEQLGPVLIAQLHAGRTAIPEDIARSLCEHAAAARGATAVYRKVFPRDRSTLRHALDAAHRDPQPWIGTPVPDQVAVHEHGRTFLVRPYDGYATGLYLDHRLGRQQIHSVASGKRVLNTFAYTCGYTVAAAVGGAAATTSVDISRRALEWGKQNMTANGVDLEQHRFICSDTLGYYRRAQRQRQVFDYIVLDPPTFARVGRGKRTFSLSGDLPKLVAGALDLLASGGFLRLSVNHRQTPRRRLFELIQRAAEKRRRTCQKVSHPSLPEDFRGAAESGKSVLVRVD